jgi:hypothetical protein
VFVFVIVLPSRTLGTRETSMHPSFDDLLKDTWWDKLIDTITLRNLCAKLERLADHKLRVNVYSLDGDTIVKDRGKRPEDRLELSRVDSWTLFYEMCFDIVIINLNDQTQIVWLDKYDDLIGILREHHGAREIPYEEYVEQFTETGS